MQELASNPWSKWWWLRIDQIRVWSEEERRAAGALYLTQAVLWLFWSLAGVGLLLGLHVSRDLGFQIAIPVATILSLSQVRQVASDVFHAVAIGEAASVARVGGWLPQDVNATLVSSFIARLTYVPYWGDLSGAGCRYSREEQWVREAVILIALALFLGPFPFEFRLVQSLGLPRWVGALIVLAHFLLSLNVARQICVWIWPDRVQQADNCAFEREHGSTQPPATRGE